MRTTTQLGGNGQSGAFVKLRIPFQHPIGSFLGFLAHLFALGREYQSLNVYQSAVSSTHLPVDGFPIGQHPLVSRLLKVVFNTRLPQSKYGGTWEVSSVLDYLCSLGRNDLLSLSVQTKKLAMLLALVSAQRSSDLVRPSLPVMQTSNGISISLNGLAKQSQPEVRNPSTSQNSHMCPVKRLKE